MVGTTLSADAAWDLLWELSSMARLPRRPPRHHRRRSRTETLTLRQRWPRNARPRPPVPPDARSHYWAPPTRLRTTPATPLQSSEEFGSNDRGRWRLRASPASAQSVRELSRLIALPVPLSSPWTRSTPVRPVAGKHRRRDDRPGDAVLGRWRTTDGGPPTMAHRRGGRLPTTVWEHVRTGLRPPWPTDFGSPPRCGLSRRPISAAPFWKRRFVASYGTNGFQPRYPSWPILPAAFADAPDLTRQLVITPMPPVPSTTRSSNSST